jgi:hypothetical protein
LDGFHRRMLIQRVMETNGTTWDVEPRFNSTVFENQYLPVSDDLDSSVP